MSAAQLPQVLEWAHCTTGVESVVFNMGLDEIQTESFPSDHSGYQNYVGGPAVLGVSGITYLTKYLASHDFLVLGKKRTLSDLSSDFILYQMLEETFPNNW